jgi:hypothetical protein
MKHHHNQMIYLKHQKHHIINPAWMERSRTDEHETIKQIGVHSSIESHQENVLEVMDLK